VKEPANVSVRFRGISPVVTAGHSRSKNGVATLAYDPVVHAEVRLTMDCRIKSGNDAL
jgi:hypothetical protein